MAEYRAYSSTSVHRPIARHRLILTKSDQQVGKRLLRNLARANRLGESDKYRVARLAAVAGIELASPKVEERERLLAIPDLIAQIVRDAAIRVDAVKVRPQPGGKNHEATWKFS